MSVGLLEPPVEAPEKHGDDEPAPASPAPTDDEASSGGYAVRFARRRKVAPRAHDDVRARRRLRRQAESQRRRLLGVGLKAGVPGLLVLAVAWALGGRGEEPVELPPELPAAHFQEVLPLDRTARVGTLFQAALREAPSPSQADDFRLRVDTVVDTLSKAGYESILLQAPDGTTVVSGTLDHVVVGPLGVSGT